MKACCAFSLEYHSQLEKENHTKLSPICMYEIFYKGPKKEFETAEANESSVFEPLKFYCTVKSRY